MYEKQKAHNLALWAQRRPMLIALLGGKCIKCGTIKELQFDHIDPNSKSYEIIELKTAKLDRLLQEIAKCQLLCKSCHKIKSAEERKRPIPHGTHAGYCRGCRCEDCKEAHSKYAAEWYLKKKIEDVKKSIPKP